MRIVNILTVFWAVLLASTSTSPARMVPFTASELAELPREAHGLKLHVRAVKDTFLLGEPIMIEVFLNNSTGDTLIDPCMLRPAYGPLRIYIIRPDSEAVRIDPEIHGDTFRVDYFKIPPGRCAGSVVVFGSYSLIWIASSRGADEHRTQHFSESGTHRFLATYYRRPGNDERGIPVNGAYMVSNLDSLFVDEPTGWDKTVYETIGDSLFSLQTVLPTRKSFRSRRWVKDPVFWENLCLMDSASVYAPWLRAGHARSLCLARGTDSERFEPAIAVLNDLVTRYPRHPLSEEAEFSIAAMLCFIDRASEGKAHFVKLLEKYPENVRAYATCSQDGGWKWREDLPVRGICEEVP